MEKSDRFDLVKTNKIYTTKDTLAAIQVVYQYFSSLPFGHIEWVHFLTVLNLSKAM